MADDWEDWEAEDFVPTKEEDKKFNDEVATVPTEAPKITEHHSAAIQKENQAKKAKKAEFKDAFGQTRELTPEERAEYSLPF